ncbi:unnamed protein product [Schistosoma curassoni]|uniref:Secreted protein n=1 Tax=Schistosoma curassoni TaxID=6186 RepID=A0A183JJG0_9TREM|nr:unnamed protein product [Schistosoma curassoni]
MKMDVIPVMIAVSVDLSQVHMFVIATKNTDEGAVDLGVNQKNVIDAVVAGVETDIENAGVQMSGIVIISAVTAVEMI